MRFPKAICLITLVIINISDTKGLIARGNSNTSHLLHGSQGHSVDMAEVMKILGNLTQQVENDRNTIQLL